MRASCSSKAARFSGVAVTATTTTVLFSGAVEVWA